MSRFKASMLPLCSAVSHHILIFLIFLPSFMSTQCVLGPWLWRSWQSGRLRHQRSTVQIPTWAIKFSNIIICQLQSRKDENKEKEAGNDPIKKAILSCAAWTISGFTCTQAGAKNLKDIGQRGGGGTRRRMDELRSESCEFKSPFTHKLCLIAFWCWLFSDFLRSSYRRREQRV